MIKNYFPVLYGVETSIVNTEFASTIL